MRARARLRRMLPRRRGQLITSALLAILIVVPLAIAVLHPGFPSSEVAMRSRDVWVTNAHEQRAGRLNAQVSEIDASLSLDSDRLDVFQDGDDVFVHDVGGGTIGRVDPMYTDLRERIAVPAEARAAYGGNVLAILDSGTGRLWSVDTRGPLTFDAAGASPILTLGPNAQVVVTHAGVILAASPSSNGIYRISKPGADPVLGRLDGAASALADYELTAVGDVGAILDRSSSRVLIENGPAIALDEPGVRIQQPGPKRDDVVLASARGFLLAPLSGGAAKPVAWPGAQGQSIDPHTVAQPVVVNGCALGAWAATSEVAKACDGAEPSIEKLPPRDGAGELVFRVNRDLVALNDLQSGNVWLPLASLRFVENWQDTVPPEDKEGEEGDREATEESFEDTLAERTEDNHPPQLLDDEFGARAGESTFLPVLDNDTDPDGDLISITEIQGAIPADIGVLERVDEGRALQFTARPGASGEFTVTYIGTDGRPNGIAQARLTIRLVGAAEGNRPPASRHASAISVEAGRQIRYSVLGDWQDPEGDPIYLLSARAPAGATVSSSPDGMITFTSVGAELGELSVSYTVSDGEHEATGELTVEIAAPDTLSPVATPDFARGLAGTAVVARPLANDLAPAGGVLQLVEIAELGGSSGAKLNPDLQTVTYRTDRPGSYYVEYTVKGGGTETKGLIRFEIEDPAAASRALTAVRDVAYLRPGQPATVSPLLNDQAADDEVLSVQSIETTDEARAAGLSVELLDNTVVRVTTQNALQHPIELPYTATDGAKQATGTVVVVPVEPAVEHHPPVALDDVRTVRTGDYTTVDVLANDVHPDEGTMRLEPELADPHVGGGFAFVSGNRVRFQAPQEAGTYSATYVVTDDHGEQGSARVSFHVTALDETSNRPPTPSDETARVFEGSTIRVDVPLSGVDPDGDSVTFTGITGLPSLGSIREQDETSFLYEAFPGAAGTDELRYEVVDTFGARGTGTIRIGVVPRPDQTEPPVAVDDLVEAKPGALISVPVLENDSDPNDYPIELSDDLSEIDPALEPAVDSGSLLLRVPADVPFASVPYRIANGHGGTDEAYVNITVTPDAPERSPLAIDHVVSMAAFDGVDHVDVALRDGGRNPSGRIAELEVTTAGVNAGLGELVGDGMLRVRPTDRRQVIAYTLADRTTGRTASAFVMVPALVNEESKRQSPYLKTDLASQVTPVDTPMRWNVNDLVTAPSGLPVHVIEPESAWAEQGDGSPVAVSDTGLAFAPKPGFRGPGSITFLVSDAQSPDDDKAGVATIRLPITIGDPNLYDVAPTFVTPQITLPAGTTKDFDLASATGHPNPAVIPQVQFSGLRGGTADVSAQLAGTRLSLAATRQARPGEVLRLEVTYAFRDFIRTGEIAVTVTSSPLPPPRVVEDDSEAKRGQPIRLRVLDNDFNPYPDVPLQIADAKEVSASSTGAKIAVDSGAIRVEPSGGFLGEITIQYTVRDDTKDPLRDATGYARVRIVDVPDAPPAVKLEPLGDAQLTASWTAPPSNGKPITGYEVTLTPNRADLQPLTMQSGVAGSLTFTRANGLVNGVSYVATVRAVNEIGWGPFSSPSAGSAATAKPTAPQNVAVADAFTAPGRHEGTLTVTWNPPLDDGGGVERYTVRIVSPTPKPGEGVFEVDGRARKLDLERLRTETATQFSVTVTAQNRSGATTSDPAVGTLTYQPNPEVGLQQGDFIKSVEYFPGLREDAYQYFVKGNDFVPDATYDVQCVDAGGRKGEHWYRGADINRGVVPDCVMIAGLYRAEVYLDGKLVATSNTILRWRKP